MFNVGIYVNSLILRKISHIKLCYDTQITSLRYSKLIYDAAPVVVKAWYMHVGGNNPVIVSILHFPSAVVESIFAPSNSPVHL